MRMEKRLVSRGLGVYKPRVFIWRKDVCRKCGRIQVIGLHSGASGDHKRKCIECKSRSLFSVKPYEGPKGTIVVGEEKEL